MNIQAVQKTFNDWAPICDAAHGWLPKRHAARLTLDMGHHTREKLQRVFPNVQVYRYWLGMLFVAVARKG